MPTTEEAVQAHLNGVWNSTHHGCPHIHGMPDGPYLCDTNKMRPCIYEIHHINGCELFQEILEEWRIELEICPECGVVRPGDERVKAGMKCGFCSYIAVAYRRKNDKTDVGSRRAESL